MTNLRWYEVEQLTESARLLKQRLDAGVAGWLEFSLAASQYVLRDDGGAYWFLDPFTDSWQRHDQAGWCPVRQQPEARLEGLQALAEHAVLPAGLISELDDPFGAKESWQPQEVILMLVHKAGQDYRVGAHASDEVELLLGRMYLMDRQGRFWTVGIHSQQWYRYADANWVKVEHGPDPDQLVRWRGGLVKCEQCGAEVEDATLCPNCGAPLIPGLEQLDPIALQRFYRFLVLGAGSLPEPVSSPWEPPPELPRLESELRCEVCGTISLPGGRFCSHCGASLGCPNCGAANPPGSLFCGVCGQALTAEGSES
jgi:ribosomal protein L32